MTTRAAWANLLADAETVGVARDRLDLLIDEQLGAVLPVHDWAILPLGRSPLGLHLVATSSEGMRRGQEVMNAFLGPGAYKPSVVDISAGTGKDRELLDLGVRHCLQLLRAPLDARVVQRVEDAVATVCGQGAREVQRDPTHVELLRDLRLSLLNRDGATAEERLGQLRASGRLSSENLRFLQIQVLGAMHRWEELRALPYLNDLLRTRRPREVDETVLQAIWIVDAMPLLALGKDLAGVFVEAGLQERFGAVIHTPDVPATATGRLVALVAARATGNSGREERVLAACADEDELTVAVALLRDRTALEPPRVEPASDPMQELFAEGRFPELLDAYCADPTPEHADIALQAVLEARTSDHVGLVFRVLSEFVAQGRITPDRRTRRDIEDLREMAEDNCTSWLAWSARLAAESWPTADKVARELAPTWTGPRGLSRVEILRVIADITAAWSGPNQAQVAATLDLVCEFAAAAISLGASEISDDVLTLLVEQSSFTGPVREAFLGLLCESLFVGVDRAMYQELLNRAEDIWARVGSVAAADWILGLLNALYEQPCPAEDLRTGCMTKVLNGFHLLAPSLNRRQLADASGLAAKVGIVLPSRAIAVDIDADVWQQLSGRVVGLYSLLPRVGAELADRVKRLNPAASVESNSDQVASEALRNLARKADHLIVDTRHAAHAATNSIDAIRPRSRQIFPRGRGLSAFLAALEEAL